MNYQYKDLENLGDLIKGVILKKLTIHKDTTGELVETLRRDWQEVFNENNLDFAMQYLSITPPGVARDSNTWHVHKNQKDRFICVSGKIVTAIFDPRPNSKSYGELNLFVMGPEKEKEMYMLVIPEETYHGFVVVSKEAGFLLNFPTQLYNQDDEGRIKNQGRLDWQKIREDFGVKKT